MEAPPTMAIVFLTLLFVVFGLPALLYGITQVLFLRDLELDVVENDIDDDLNS